MDKVILLTVLSLFAGPSQAARIQTTSVINTAINKLAGDDKCVCGLERKEGWLTTGEKVDFEIGEGVDYKPSPSQCLTKCWAPMTGSYSCDEMTKVARKADGRKLCCKVNKCTYLPAGDKWVRKAKGQTQLFPLTPLDGVHRVSGYACLCCTKKTAWGPEVNAQCKYAYGASEKGVNSNKGLAWEAVKDVLGMGLNQYYFTQNCKTYCERYPEYPVFLKTLTNKFWTEAVYENIETMKQKLTVGVREAGELKDNLSENPESLGHVYHLLEETLNQAETDTWSSRLEPKLIEDAKAALEKVKAPYVDIMNKKLRDVIDKPDGTKEEMGEKLKAVLKEIDPEVVDERLLAQTQKYLALLERVDNDEDD